MSGALAQRLKSVLLDLIHENQKGFLTGRYIGENVRLLYDVIEFTEEHNILGLITLIDFEKAFDSLSWKFMNNTLEFFNFSPKFKQLINMLHNETNLSVVQYGISSEFFKVGRGCKQGDPISHYLFILSVEILGYLIRNNKEIKGLQIGGKEYKLLQYADDTAIILDGSEKSLKKTLDLLHQFAKYSGLKPNFEKKRAVFGFSQEKIICKNYVRMLS